MKRVITIIIVVIVILGLAGGYLFAGYSPAPRTTPTTQGPSGPPPTN